MAKTTANVVGNELTTEEEAFFSSGGQLDLAMPEADEGRPDDEPEAPVEDPPALEEPQGDPADAPAEPQGEPPAERETRQQRYVPTATLIEERRLRQEAEARARANEQELLQRRDVQTRIEERLRVLAEQRAAEQQAAQTYEAPLPDPDEDPFAYERAARERLEARIGRHEQSVAQERQQQDQYRQQQEFQQRASAAMAVVQNQTQQFASRVPDYYDALRYAQERRDQELEMMGYAPQQRQGIIQNEAGMIVAGAQTQGKNPAEVLYQLAQRWGYQPGNGNGAQRAAPQAQSGNQRVDQLSRGMQASRTLSSRPGVQSGPGVSLEKLANMPEDEFDRIVGKNPAEWERAVRRGF